MKFKSLLFLSLAAIASGGAQAQGIAQNAGSAALQNCLQLQHQTHHNLNTVAKATNVNSRLIAYAYDGYDGVEYVPQDSTSFVYSGNRGGDFLTDVLKFDNSYDYTYSTTASSYGLYSKSTQTFDAGNNILTLAYQVYMAATNTFENYSKNINTYDGNNNELTSVRQYWDNTSNNWYNSVKFIYAYDGNNNETTYSYQNWNSTTSVWVNANRYNFSYNAANKVMGYVAQTWNVTNSVWINAFKYDYTYDVNNNQTSSEEQTWNAGSGSWKNTNLTTSSFDGGNLLEQQIYQVWDATNDDWKNSVKYIYSDFAGTNAQTEIIQSWIDTAQVWVNNTEYLSTYNSYGQIATQATKNWNAGGFWEITTSNSSSRYHYEDYNLAVNTVSQKGGSASIYPVPAQAQLNIDLKWDNAQDATITIYDIQGRLYRQLQTGNTAQYSKTMNVSDLAAGNYIINISGEKGSIVKHLIVAR